MSMPGPGMPSRVHLHDFQHPPGQLEGDRRLAFLLHPSVIADIRVELGQLAIGFHRAGRRQLCFPWARRRWPQSAAGGRDVGRTEIGAYRRTQETRRETYE